MPTDDYRQDSPDVDFNAIQQDISRRRKFGFNTGLGTQAPVGGLPSQEPAQQPPMRRGPNWGGSPNYGFSGSNYPGGGQGSFSQAGGSAMTGSAGDASGSITAPAKSRLLGRNRGITQNISSGSYNTDSSVNIRFGDVSSGNVSTGGGDILGSGAQQDKRVQTAVVSDSGNVDYKLDASGGAGGTSGSATGGAGGAGGPASAGSSASATAPPKRPKTGGKVAGQVSDTPEAARKRAMRAAARASATATGGAGGAGGDAKTGSASGGRGGDITGGDVSTGPLVDFGSPSFRSSAGPSGPTSVGSGNREVVQQGTGPQSADMSQSQTTSTTRTTTNNNRQAPASTPPRKSGATKKPPAKKAAPPAKKAPAKKAAAPAKKTTPRKSGAKPK